MRKKGLIGTIWSIISAIVVIALLLAILPFFNWDIFALIFWCFSKIWEIIIALADKISTSSIFRSLFK